MAYSYVDPVRNGQHGRLVIRGNPRIIACNLSVELPLSLSPCPVSDTAKAAQLEQKEQNQLNKHQPIHPT